MTVIVYLLVIAAKGCWVEVRILFWIVFEATQFYIVIPIYIVSFHLIAGPIIVEIAFGYSDFVKDVFWF